jgi:23S rRNA (uracil1939-C5)-methyltransferase
VGVEGVEPAVLAAQDNARANGITNAEFVVADANGAFPLNMAKVDVAVLDPPREGAAGAVKRLLELRPERICYVSCDPSTLARDLVPLQHGGYEVVRARAFDFFPQTFHIEGLVVLRRI